MSERAAAARLEQVFVAEDGAALVAADEDAARNGGDAADRLPAIAVVELVAIGVVGGEPATAELGTARVPAGAECEQDTDADADRGDLLRGPVLFQHGQRHQFYGDGDAT